MSVRAEASRQVREAIVEATVRICAQEGVAAVTHRRVAAEAGVSLSSTTWHFATKADILEAALRWTERHEVDRIAEIAARIGGPDDWADELGEWLVDQVTGEREIAVALYRLQLELLGSPGALAVHLEWGRELRAFGDGVLEGVDARLVIAALDGLRLSVLLRGETDTDWLRVAVRRLLGALLSEG
jgi:TetR/AcrR family transcriptional regulator, regulator of biofilm formation and stress response